MVWQKVRKTTFDEFIICAFSCFGPFGIQFLSQSGRVRLEHAPFSRFYRQSVAIWVMVLVLYLKAGCLSKSRHSLFGTSTQVEAKAFGRQENDLAQTLVGKPGTAELAY